MAATNTARPATGLVSALSLFGLLVLAAKLLLIANFGSATPLWDQWEAEGMRFYALLLRERMSWLALFDGYNEHRIAMTRLLDMVLLALNGEVWNPRLQMVVNACLHVAALVLLLYCLCRACASSQRLPLLAFATLLFCLPLGCENTLWGFQSQLYFALLFSIAFLWCLSTAAPFSARWWLAMLCAVLAIFSFGTGTLALLAGLAVLLLRYRLGLDHGSAHRRAIAVLALLAMAAILTTPPGARTLNFLVIASPWEQGKYLSGLAGAPPAPAFIANPRAESPGEFLLALVSAASWPTLLLAPLVYYPLLRFMGATLRQPAPDRRVWFVLALGVWMLGQIIALAYGRAKSPLVSRYADIYAIGILLNYYCLLQLPPAPGRWQARLPTLWLAVVTLALSLQGAMALDYVATIMAPAERAQQQHIIAYLQTGNPARLESPEFANLLPGPEPATLARALDDPALRYTLPPELLPAHAARQAHWVSTLLARLRPGAELLLTLALCLGCYWLGRGRDPLAGAPARR
jgi:hypothetical protein